MEIEILDVPCFVTEETGSGKVTERALLTRDAGAAPGDNATTVSFSGTDGDTIAERQEARASEAATPLLGGSLVVHAIVLDDVAGSTVSVWGGR